MKRLLAILLVFALAGGALFAQNKASLQIQCNQSGAQVFIGGRLAGTTTPNLALLVNPGTYPVKVIKTGFQDFDTTITVPSSGFILQVNLLAKGAIAPPPPPPQPTSFALQVVAPQPNAQVLIDGVARGMAPVTVQVSPGQHTVIVRAPNTFEWKQVVNVTGNMTVNTGALTPQPPPAQQFTVTANVQGAQVIINGNVAGQVPFQAQLAPGSYAVTVRAPGYLDFNQNVVMNGPTQVNANLLAQTFQLQVNANVQGAQVLVNGNPFGQTPFVTQLPPGSYTLTVRAPGYSDYAESFTLNGPKTVSVSLQPSVASFQITLPAANINPDTKGGHWSQIQVYIDGVLQKNQNAQLTPGRHLIRISSGGMQVETFIDVQAGKAYVLEPFMGLTVK